MPDTKQIFLTGFVGGWMAEDLRWDIKYSNEKRIDLFISSYGGSVDSGFEIANIVQAMNATGSKEIHTHILSHADSIATVIFLSAPQEKRHIVESSTMFIHDPRVIIFDEVTQEDAEKMAEMLSIQKNRIADFYTSNIEDLEKEEALSLMSGEKTLTAARMVELGIVKEVLPHLEMAASKNIITNFNQNNNKMGLFNSKNPTNTVVLDDGSILLYQEDLAKGTEVQKAGELVDLEGEHVMNDKRTLIIDKDNKIVDIKEATVENKGNFDADAFRNEIAEQTAIAITNALKPVNDALSALKGTHRPEKSSGVNNQVNNSKRPQAEARKSVNDYMKENVDVQKNRN